MTRTKPGLAAALATERVAIYARISEDPRKKEEGVERQRNDGLATAAQRGWAVQGVYVDNDISALRGKVRPEYDRMMAAVMRGEVTRIVAYGLSRLWRNRSERAGAIEVLGQLRCSVTLVKGGELDLSSAFGRTTAGLMGEVDTMESEIKAERVAAAALDRAEQGRANAHVAYGWRREYTRAVNGEVLAWHDVEDEDQAAVVREIVDRLLDEESIKAITARLNGRQVPPPRAALRALNDEPAGTRGTPQVWRPSTVRKIALRSANVGLVSRGEYEYVPGAPGAPAKRRRTGVVVIGDAAWPAIVDAGKHEEVVAMLGDPTRATSRSGARKHLLSYGIGECGLCGSVLRHKIHSGTARRSGRPAGYTCDVNGCTSRSAEHVDALVERTVIKRLARPDARELLVRDDGTALAARERATGLRAKLAQAQDDYDADVITREMYLRSTTRHRAALAEADEEAMRAVQGIAPRLVARLAGSQAQAEWDVMDTGQRRALLEAMGVTVAILRTKPGPGFDPASVRITFRDDAEVAATA